MHAVREKHSFVFQCVAHDLVIISWTRSEIIWRAHRELLFLMTMLITIAGDEEFTRAHAYRESLREIIAWAQVAGDRSSRYQYSCILKAHTRECIRAMQGGCHCGNRAIITHIALILGRATSSSGHPLSVSTSFHAWIVHCRVSNEGREDIFCLEEAYVRVLTLSVTVKFQPKRVARVDMREFLFSLLTYR